MGALSDLARRLQPLGQMAESAGSLFGLRPFASLLGGTPPPARADAPAGDHRPRARGRGRQDDPSEEGGRRRSRGEEGPGEEDCAADQAESSEEGGRLEEGGADRSPDAERTGSRGQCLATNGVVDDSCRGRAGAADVDHDRGADLGGRRHEREGDAVPEDRREVAAGDHADRLIVDEHGTIGARRPPALGGDAHQRRRDARGALGCKRLAPTELVLRPRDDPPEPGLQRGDARAQLVTVQWQGCLEPQRVASTEAGGRDAGAGDRGPQIAGGCVGHGDLDAGFAGVAGAGDDARRCPPT